VGENPVVSTKVDADVPAAFAPGWPPMPPGLYYVAKIRYFEE
jgi:hypothetical protein